MDTNDIATYGAGVAAWTLAIVPVKWIGNVTATGEVGNKVFAVVLGTLIAYGTTPIMSYMMGWKTQYERVRGIAIALGTAQTIDGLVHLFVPNFYHDDRGTAIMSSANIFFGAGLLGIFSAYA